MLLRIARRFEIVSRAIRIGGNSAAIRLVQGAGVGLLLLALLGAILVGTEPWSEPPADPGLSREPLFADYSVPLTRIAAAKATTVQYSAQTAFWALLPEGWKNSADWRLVLRTANPQAVVDVGVGGESIQQRDSSVEPFYSIPSRLIHRETLITISSADWTDPKLLVHWNRSYVFPSATKPGAGVSLIEFNGRPIGPQTMGVRLENCAPGPTSVVAFIKWCSPTEQTLTMGGSGWAKASLPKSWPNRNSSVSLWVRPASRGHFYLLSAGDDTTHNSSLKITLDGAGTILIFMSTDGSSQQVLAANQQIPLGVWSHIALSLSGRDVDLYVNGTAVNHFHLPAPIREVPSPIVFGSDFSSPGLYYYALDGQMADVYLADHSIDSRTARQLYMADVVKDPNGYLSHGASIPRAGLPFAPWWQSHLAVAVAIAIAYLTGCGLLAGWSVRQIRLLIHNRIELTALVITVAAIGVASALTTNYDLQLFKGLAEGYWINGPLPALALSGYGPLVDLLFTVPSLPYALLAGSTGMHSELALNFAIRLPFLVGWLFLLASTGHLVEGLRRDNGVTFPWLLLILNPLGLVVTLWQPEAALTALVVLSFAMLFENRSVAAGVLLGIACTGKYWPVVVGPIGLLAAWRLSGRRGALEFVAAASSTIVAVFSVYWLPTAILLGSVSDFFGLLVTRTPYFGGTGAAAQATVWSLYALPKSVVPPAAEIAVARLEQWSLALFIGFYIGLILLSFRAPLTRFRVILAVAATLAVLAGISSLSVPQFGLWCLPFVMIAGAAGARAERATYIAVAATCSGAAVYLVSEPISYWLLHVSTAQDAFAYSIAVWLQGHVVNARLAQSLGFTFASLLVVTGGLMLLELYLDGNGRRPGRAISMGGGEVAHSNAPVLPRPLDA